MKAVLFSLLVLFSSKTSWMEAIELQILEINEKAILKRKKTVIAEKYTVNYKCFRIDKTEKISLQLSNSFCDSMNTSYYKKDRLVFAMTDFYIADYIHKGAPYPNRPKGEITEIKRYFQTDTNGIQLKRTIDYLENSNKDSLIRLLNKLDYDTTFLNAVDYQKAKRHFRYIRKHC